MEVSFNGSCKFYLVAYIERILCSWHKEKDKWFVSVSDDEA